MHRKFPPTLTAEQRQAALKLAATARRDRAEFKKRLSSGELHPATGFAEAVDTPTLARMTVIEFLCALPKIGQVRAKAVCKDHIGCSDTRRIQGLGPQQREALKSFCTSR